MSQTKILSSKPVFHAELFDVIENKIALPNGEKRTHHNIQRRPTVIVFPITPKYEIYLIKEYRYMLGKTLLEASAGFVDQDENPLKAAKRELEEETGIIASQWEKLTTLELGSSVTHSQSHLFLARELEIGIPKPEEGEMIELVKISIDEAVQKVMTGEISSSSTIVGIMMLNMLKRERKL